LIGLFLMSHGPGPNGKPIPAPPKEPPPWVLWTCLASAVFTVVATWLFWVVVRVPWATMLAGWFLICVSAGSVAWFYLRSLSRQSSADQDAAPESKETPRST